MKPEDSPFAALAAYAWSAPDKPHASRNLISKSAKATG